jgi:hypothetical protein
MTGYTVHTGSTVKFSEGWDNIFRGAARKETTGGKKKSAKSPAKKATSAKKKARRSGTKTR